MLTIEEIKALIPHRYPFLLVDRILELTKDQGAVGVKNLTANEPFFQGHFPDYAVMPGVLQVEAVAQVGAVALLYEEEGKNVFLGGIKKARFYQELRPGDQLEIHCSIRTRRGPLGLGQGEIYVQGKRVMSCELSFAIIE